MNINDDKTMINLMEIRIVLFSPSFKFPGSKNINQERFQNVKNLRPFDAECIYLY